MKFVHGKSFYIVQLNQMKANEPKPPYSKEMKEPQVSDFIKGNYITKEEDEKYWKAKQKYNKWKNEQTLKIQKR